MNALSKKTVTLASCCKFSTSLFKAGSSLQLKEFKEAAVTQYPNQLFQPGFNPSYATSPFFKTVSYGQGQGQGLQIQPSVDKKCVATTAVKGQAAATMEAESSHAEDSKMYALPLRYIHWIMATGIISVILLVQLAMNTKDTSAKGYYMMLHKSIGLAMGFLVLGRMFYRSTTKIPGHLPGSSLEIFGATLSHQTLYALMVFMPLTGVLMGYYGGKGLPFFGLTIPGASEKNKDGDIAKAAFKTHKLAGQIFYYLLPLHFGAAFYHQYFQAHNIFRRVNPLAKLAS